MHAFNIALNLRHRISLSLAGRSRATAKATKNKASNTVSVGFPKRSHLYHATKSYQSFKGNSLTAFLLKTIYKSFFKLLHFENFVSVSERFHVLWDIHWMSCNDLATQLGNRAMLSKSWYRQERNGQDKALLAYRSTSLTNGCFLAYTSKEEEGWST